MCSENCWCWSWSEVANWSVESFRSMSKPASIHMLSFYEFGLHLAYTTPSRNLNWLPKILPWLPSLVSTNKLKSLPYFRFSFYRKHFNCLTKNEHTATNTIEFSRRFAFKCLFSSASFHLQISLNSADWTLKFICLKTLHLSIWFPVPSTKRRFTSFSGKLYLSIFWQLSFDWYIFYEKQIKLKISLKMK